MLGNIDDRISFTSFGGQWTAFALVSVKLEIYQPHFERDIVMVRVDQFDGNAVKPLLLLLLLQSNGN